MMIGKTFTTIFNIISGITIILSLGTILTIAYWLFYPYEPVVFTYPKTRILNPDHKIRQGEVIQSEVDLKYNYNVPMTIDRRIVDGIVYFTPPSTIETEEGYHRYIQNGLTVPAHLPPGIYHTVLYLHFKVNPIRTIIVTRESEDFEVIPRL